MRTEQDRIDITQAVHDLFLLRGETGMLKDRVSAFVRKIDTWKFSGTSIIRAIKEVTDGDFREITPGLLYFKCREKDNELRGVNTDPRMEKKVCWWCGSIGFVTMEHGIEYVNLACICNSGKDCNKLTPWNGKEYQIVDGVRFQIEFPFLFTLRIPKNEESHYFNYPGNIAIEETAIIGE